MNTVDALLSIQEKTNIAMNWAVNKAMESQDKYAQDTGPTGYGIAKEPKILNKNNIAGYVEYEEVLELRKFSIEQAGNLLKHVEVYSSSTITDYAAIIEAFLLKPHYA